MTARATRGIKPLPLKALYTVSELCDATGLSRARLNRLLRTCQVELFSRGRSVYVPLSEIRTRLEPLWREICEAQRALFGETGGLE